MRSLCSGSHPRTNVFISHRLDSSSHLCQPCWWFWLSSSCFTLFQRYCFSYQRSTMWVYDQLKKFKNLLGLPSLALGGSILLRPKKSITKRSNWMKPCNYLICWILIYFWWVNKGSFDCFFFCATHRLGGLQQMGTSTLIFGTSVTALVKRLIKVQPVMQVCSSLICVLSLLKVTLSVYLCSVLLNRFAHQGLQSFSPHLRANFNPLLTRWRSFVAPFEWLGDWYWTWDHHNWCLWWQVG